jgi:hypothetical protein
MLPYGRELPTKILEAFIFSQPKFHVQPIVTSDGKGEEKKREKKEIMKSSEHQGRKLVLLLHI